MSQANQFILDCSVTMAWCFEDEVCKYSEQVLNHVSKNFALVPALWSMEVANVLLMAEKRTRISHAKSRAFIEFLNMLMIRVEDCLLTKPLLPLYELARETDLTVYDATYLEVAVRTGLPLATLDKALIRAAKKIGVEIFNL